MSQNKVKYTKLYQSLTGEDPNFKTDEGIANYLKVIEISQASSQVSLLSAISVKIQGVSDMIARTSN